MSLYTQTTGNGPDLVLLHGWGLHSGIWSSLLPLLEPDFRVTCIDLPGHGRSDWSGEATLDDMVRGVLAVAPPRALWAGWSLGGLVAQRAAGLDPARVCALVLIASTPCFIRKPGWQSAMLPVLLDTFAGELEQDYRKTVQRFLALQVRGSAHATDTLKSLRATLREGGAAQPAGLHAGLDILRSTDLRADAGKLQCPVLLLMGERDTLVPAAAGQAAVRLFPDARLEVIESAGHAPLISAPRDVAGRLLAFSRNPETCAESDTHG